MNCPECTSELIIKDVKNLRLLTCPNCLGMFIHHEELKKIEETEDPSVGWLDLELWRHRDKYEAVRGDLHCPSCAGHFHQIRYPDSIIEIPVCHDCRAVWLNLHMLKELHSYLEKRITTETISEYLRDVGHELMEVLKGRESLKNLGIILKLLHYRIFAELPLIENLIQNLPKL